MGVPSAIIRGQAFEKRFVEWFSSDQMFGADIKVHHVCAKVRPGYRDQLKIEAPDRNGILFDILLQDEFNHKTCFIDVALTIAEGSETTKVLIELKSRDWNRMKPGSHLKVVARDAAQLYSYQGHLSIKMWNVEHQRWDKSNDASSIQLFLIYEFKPDSEALAEEILALCGEDAIQVIWFDELRTSMP